MRDTADDPSAVGPWRTVQSLDEEALASSLAEEFKDSSAQAVIEACIARLFTGKMAVVSSFGAESGVLLSMVAEVDRAVPVLFLDTDKHFPETIAYKDEIVARLGLLDVRLLTPKPEAVAADDPDGSLHRSNPDLCCHIRKTLPLVRGLRGFSAWMSGRKRFQSSSRAGLGLFEFQDGRMKINPLASWTPDRIAQEAKMRDLPIHPLIALGFGSIGCAPCTTPVAEGEDARAGRWRETDKTECGIHISADGRITRTGATRRGPF